MICAGIDAGSRTMKVVLLESEGHTMLASAVADQGIEQDKLAIELLERVLAKQGHRREDVAAIVATGYGRKLIEAADRQVTEITCQAWGVRHQVPEVRTVVDIGGQDSKLLRLAPDGSVADFVMNDRCAAGTGRFLEVVAMRLGVKLGELGPMAARSSLPAAISSMCVVFAETEIIGLLASGSKPADIVAGVQASIAMRVAAMAGRSVSGPVVFTGGVALVPGMEEALEAHLGHPMTIAPQPQLTGALGAAILASRSIP